MNQLSLFETEKKPVERRPPDPAFIRKNLLRQLRIVRSAERMPWSEADARHWETFFPELADLLAPEEGTALKAEFAAELVRLKSVV